MELKVEIAHGVDLPRPRAQQSEAFQALSRELRGYIGADKDFD